MRYRTAPAPLHVRPRPVGISLTCLVGPVAGSHIPPGLDDSALAALHCLRTLDRPVTVIELAARVEEPVVGVCVSVHRLRENALAHVLRPSWLHHRLRGWTHGQADEHVHVDTLVLAAADPEQSLACALGQVTDTGPLPVETHRPGRMWVGISRPSPTYQVVLIAVAGLKVDDPRWDDLAHAQGVVVIGDPTAEAEVPFAAPSPLVLGGVPVVAMTAPTEGAAPYPDVVRALWGLPWHTPVVVGDPRFAVDLHTAIDQIGA